MSSPLTDVKSLAKSSVSVIAAISAVNAFLILLAGACPCQRVSPSSQLSLGDCRLVAEYAYYQSASQHYRAAHTVCSMLCGSHEAAPVWIVIAAHALAAQQAVQGVEIWRDQPERM